MFVRKMSACLLVAMISLATQAQETIMFIRHAEKPAGGLGQLNCKGLRRALALPPVLIGKFGKPDAIFAPNPSILKNDLGKMYAYIRPLATIEPTAIQLSMPINTQYGYEDVEGIVKALEAPELQNKVVFVAWEHRLIDDIARYIIKQSGGDTTIVPKWTDADFDSIYVMNLDKDADGKMTVKFSVDHEKLDGQPDTCP